MIVLRARDAKVYGRRLSALKGAPCLDHRNVVVLSRAVERLSQCECLLIRIHRIVEDALECVLTPELKIELREARLLRQPFILEIRRTDLRRILLLMNLVPNLAPEVGLPGNLQREGPNRTGSPRVC